MRRAALILVVALVAGASACGGGSSDESSSGKTERKGPKEPIKLSANNPGCKYIVAGTESRATTPGTELQYLTNPVAEPFGCYDRVSFQFSPAIAEPGVPTTTTTTNEGSASTCAPAYTVEYRKKPFGLTLPDGKAVSTSVAGFEDANYVLYVEIKPAIAVSEFPTHPSLAYPGGLKLTFQQSDMHHIVMVEWVKNLPEGEQTSVPATAPPGVPPAVPRIVWLIGLDERRPFTVDCSIGASIEGNGLPRNCENDSCTHFNVLIMK